MITAMDDKKDEENREKDAEGAKKKELREAGESIRGAAVKRLVESSEYEVDKKKKVKKPKVEHPDYMDVYNEALDLMRRRTDIDERHVVIEEQRRRKLRWKQSSRSRPRRSSSLALQ